MDHFWPILMALNELVDPREKLHPQTIQVRNELLIYVDLSSLFFPFPCSAFS